MDTGRLSKTAHDGSGGNRICHENHARRNVVWIGLQDNSLGRIGLDTARPSVAGSTQGPAALMGPPASHTGTEDFLSGAGGHAFRQRKPSGLSLYHPGAGHQGQAATRAYGPLTPCPRAIWQKCQKGQKNKEDTKMYRVYTGVGTYKPGESPLTCREVETLEQAIDLLKADFWLERYEKEVNGHDRPHHEIVEYIPDPPAE